MNLQTEVTRKQSTPSLQKNKHFLPPVRKGYVCVSGGKKCPFFGNLAWFTFLSPPFWDSPFWFITDENNTGSIAQKICKKLITCSSRRNLILTWVNPNYRRCTFDCFHIASQILQTIYFCYQLFQNYKI